MNNMHMSLNRYYISVKLIMQSQCVQQGYYQSSYLQNYTLLFFLNCALKCNKSYTDILVCPLKLICVAETKRCIRKRNMIFILQNFLFLNKKIYKSMKFMVRIFFFFLGPLMQHVEVPRLGVKLKLSVHRDPSHICDLYCSLWLCWILHPLSKARDQTHILLVTS